MLYGKEKVRYNINSNGTKDRITPATYPREINGFTGFSVLLIFVFFVRIYSKLVYFFILLVYALVYFENLIFATNTAMPYEV